MQENGYKVPMPAEMLKMYGANIDSEKERELYYQIINKPPASPTRHERRKIAAFMRKYRKNHRGE